MIQTARLQKSTTLPEPGRTTVSTIHKNGQSTDTRKRLMEMSSNATSTNFRSQVTFSDISADDAEEALPSKRRRVSIIHSYAEKLSDVEYSCTLCMKVNCSITTAIAFPWWLLILGYSLRQLHQFEY